MTKAEYERMYRKRMAKRRAEDPQYAAEQRRKWAEIRARRREYYLAYCREYNPGYYDRNREKLLEQSRKYAKTHPEKRREYGKRYSNSEKGKRVRREAMRDYVESLPDFVVRSYLKNKHNWKGIEIPREVIETKRAQIQLKREIRKWQSTT